MTFLAKYLIDDSLVGQVLLTETYLQEDVCVQLISKSPYTLFLATIALVSSNVLSLPMRLMTNERTDHYPKKDKRSDRKNTSNS
jgi:hypothetical protein